MTNFQDPRPALALAILMVFLPLGTSDRSVVANAQSAEPATIIGTWDWSFGQAPEAPVRAYGTVVFKDEGRRMTWSINGDSGTWEGPMEQGVLLRWDKGSIDMLELQEGGTKLGGKNADGLVVEGKRRSGKTDSMVGTWTWSFGKPGQLVENGTVDFDINNRMRWSTNGDGGTWEGPMKQAVLLRWDKGSIDMLELKEGGTKLGGKNAQKWKVEGKKKRE